MSDRRRRRDDYDESIMLKPKKSRPSVNPLVNSAIMQQMIRPPPPVYAKSLPVYHPSPIVPPPPVYAKSLPAPIVPPPPVYATPMEVEFETTDGRTWILLNDKLGGGEFGSVYKGYEKSNPSNEVAIKHFKLPNDFREEAETAVLIASGWHSTPVGPVPYFQTVEGFTPSISDITSSIQSRTKYPGDMFIVYKKALGSLEDWRATHSPTKEQYDTMFDSLYNGLVQMHELGYAHRDIKPKNILVFEDESSPGGFAFTFGDLGTVCGRGAGAPDCVTYNRTTVSYIPWSNKPNTLPNGSVIGNSGYRDFDQVAHVDMYGLACSLHFMITGSDDCLNNWRMWRQNCFLKKQCNRDPVELGRYPPGFEVAKDAIEWMLNAPVQHIIQTRHAVQSP